MHVVVFTLCGLISAFLLASGYESVYNRTLPFVHTLEAVNLSAVSGSYNLQKAADYPNSYYGTFGKPQTLELPSASVRLNIVAPVQQGKQWLARTSTLHLLIPQAPRSGNIGVALLYCRSSFRTINDQNVPTTGANLFIDTDHSWRYVYKVTTARAYPENEPYILADSGSTGKLLIVCNDAGQRQNLVIEATLLSVQGVTQ